MIVAVVETRNHESQRNENVIDLSLEDDFPGKSENVEIRSSTHTNSQKVSKKDK